MLASQYALREDCKEGWNATVPRPADQVASVLHETLPLLNADTLYARLQARAEIGKFQCAIGATTVDNNIQDLMSSCTDELSSSSTSDDDLDK